MDVPVDKFGCLLTIAQGIMYLGAPFTFAVLQWWPKYRRYYAAIGLGIIAIALVLSSFSTRVWHLILTQGVLYAIGGNLLYTPTVLFLDEWLIKRKGFAYGVMWAGTGVSGICVPLVMNWGLGKYGHSTMLRTWAITVVILSARLLYYVRPRIPHSVSSRPRRLDMSFVRTSTFWTLQAGNIMESLGFFIPNIWLPTYARSIGLSSLAETMTVILFNTTSILSQVLLKTLIDRLHVTDVILISSIGAALSDFLFWVWQHLCPFFVSLASYTGLLRVDSHRHGPV